MYERRNEGINEMAWIQPTIEVFFLDSLVRFGSGFRLGLCFGFGLGLYVQFRLDWSRLDYVVGRMGWREGGLWG